MTDLEKQLLEALEAAQNALTEWKAPEELRRIVMGAAHSEVLKAKRALKASQKKKKE